MKNLIRNITFWYKKAAYSGKPKFILHIGVEKTGTTTIQEFLHLNRSLLSDQGIYFPRFMNLRNHQKLAVFCSNEHKSNQFTKMNDIDEPGKRRKWKNDLSVLFDKKMKKLSGNYHSVLISAEHFSSLLREQNEIQNLKKFLGKYASSFSIIIYIRRQDLIAGSMISNAAKAGIGKAMPAGDEIFRRHFYDYNQLLKKWSNVFERKNIRLCIFEKPQLQNGDLLKDFMMQAGISQDEQFKFPGRLNTSLSATAVEAAFLFNKLFPVDQSSMDLKTLRDFREDLITWVNQNYPGPGIKLLKHDAETFLKYYEKSNRQVALEWFGREQLFSSDFSMYTDNESKADPKIVHRLVNDFIKRKNLTPGQ